MNRKPVLAALMAAAFGFSLPAAGQFGPYPNAATSEALPADFRGRIVYSGSYEGSATIASRRTRRIDLGSTAETLLSGNRRQYTGDFTADVIFNGNRVTGTYRGTGGIDTTNFSGTRSGGRCRLFNTISGASVDVECSRTRFAGTIRSAAGERQDYQVSIQAAASRFVNSSVEEEGRRSTGEATAAAGQSPLPEKTRERAAEATPTNALPRASARQTRMLAEALAKDSQSWSWNRYDNDSLENVRVDSRAGGTTLRGEYTYNGMNRGWVEAQLRNGQIICLRYHDTNACAPVRNPSNLISPSASGSHSSTVSPSLAGLSCVRLSSETVTSTTGQTCTGLPCMYRDSYSHTTSYDRPLS